MIQILLSNGYKSFGHGYFKELGDYIHQAIIVTQGGIRVELWCNLKHTDEVVYQTGQLKISEQELRTLIYIFHANYK